jgi:hypothetical protein
MAFDSTSAKSLIAFAADIEGVTPPLTPPPLPSNWSAIFTSPDLGPFQNKWQLWVNQQAPQYAVVIRGTISKPGSILEDVMAVMIPAKGILPLGSVQFQYHLADDPKAAVHYGFTLGMALLLFDRTNGILSQLQQVPNRAEVFITGHSQGAAIATLCRSFLDYSPILAEKQFTYPAYLFAQPKPGNDHYGWDFERLVRNADNGFRITNTEDWVPQVPITLQLLGSLNQPNPLDVLTDGTIFKIISKGIDEFQDHVINVQRTKHLPQLRRLETVLKDQTLQPYTPLSAATILPIVPTLNFVNCGSPISLPGTPGTNPQNPQDYFWQHHAAMYYNLLNLTFPEG